MFSQDHTLLSLKLVIKIITICSKFEDEEIQFKGNINSSQKVRKLFLLDFHGKSVKFCQLSFISLESPCVYLFNDISSIKIGNLRAKIQHFEYD